MRGRFNRKDAYWDADMGPSAAVEVISPGEPSPLPRESTSSEGPDSPLSGSADMGLDDRPQNSKIATMTSYPNIRLIHIPEYGLEKRYLGVRVKMPVKDMLRSIRLAQGCDPQELQCENFTMHIYSTGEKKRVNTCKERRASKRKRPNKSLEELAFIVEVLEEDLKMGNPYSSLRPSANSDPSSAFLLSFSAMEPSNTPPPHGESSCSSPELSSCCSTSDLRSPSNDSTSDGGSSDCLSQGLPSSQQCMAGCHRGNDSDDMIPSPKYMAARSSPRSVEFWHAAPRQSPEFADPGYDLGACFLSQLQREENALKGMSDSMLLASDGQGRLALHRVVCLGKRAQGYAIAKRMASIHCLDLKDSEGMTALHLAARHNQPLMAADLIGLGANANEKDASGKTCLHISAERGHICVLQVLNHMMSNGVFVDMDATDNYGLSVLQCAALGLSTRVWELEGRASLARLHTLRKEQMMETLECLLQMDSHPPTPEQSRTLLNWEPWSFMKTQKVKEVALREFEKQDERCEVLLLQQTCWAIKGRSRAGYVAMDIADTTSYDLVKAAIFTKYEIHSDTYRLKVRAMVV
ncbi:unnamed protein product [Lota lota]